jgi:DNA polymerase-3 subunit epsilon
MITSIKELGLSELSYTVVDTETTGLSPYKGARLVEIGAVKINQKMNLDLNCTFSQLINPETKIPYSAYKIHKISNEMTDGKPKIDEVLPEFSRFAENTVIVAHNARFDYSFIDYYMRKHNMQCNLIHIVDTLKLTRQMYPEIRQYSLDKLIEFFDLDSKTKILLSDAEKFYRHRALFDAINTALVFIKCVEKARRLGLPEKLGTLI